MLKPIVLPDQLSAGISYQRWINSLNRKVQECGAFLSLEGVDGILRIKITLPLEAGAGIIHYPRELAWE